jgi:HEPN domain-containing protein
VLSLHGLDYPRTHNLEELANLIADAGVHLPMPARGLRPLNPFAVMFRYDDQAIGLLNLDAADAIALRVLEWARDLVGVLPA